MEFAKVVVLRGSNHWAAVSVVDVLVDLRSWPEIRVDNLPLFRERFEHSITLIAGRFQPTGLANSSHWTVVETCDRLSDLLRNGTHVAQVMQYTVQMLHSTIGVDSQYGETHETNEGRVFRVICQYEEENVALACFETARQMCLRAKSGDEFDALVEVRKLVDLGDDKRLGPSSRSIVNAATHRDIPFRRLNSGSLVQYGEGKWLRRTWTAETDATSAIGESIASDKALTKRLLLAAGVPVPLGRRVTDAEDAWLAANEIGFPVVVKPCDANHARGISLDLTTREQVLAAYDWAIKDGETNDVMVEQFAQGQHHRILVVGNQMIAASRGGNECVIGDGKSTIAQLVDEVNLDPRRGENYTDPLQIIKLNEASEIQLQLQGFTVDSVPPLNQSVIIQYVADCTIDCTDEVHPDVAARAVLAARVVGLDVAGMDLVASDISRPLEAQRGMIVEVNAGPGLGMHIAPLQGKPRPVGEAIINSMFAPGHNGRLPIIAVCGGGPRLTVVRDIEAALRAGGRQVGMANSEGVYFGGRRYSQNVRSDQDSLLALLSHPYVDTVVLENRPEQAIREGIGYLRLDVVLVPELPKSEHRDLNLDKNPTPEWLAIVAALRAVPSTGTAILPAGGPEYDSLLHYCRGKVVFYDAREEHTHLQRQWKLGRRIAFLRGDKAITKSSQDENVVGKLEATTDTAVRLAVYLAVGTVI